MKAAERHVNQKAASYSMQPCDKGLGDHLAEAEGSTSFMAAKFGNWFILVR